MEQITPDGARNILAPEELDLMNRYWQAANYLSVGQIYLMNNPLLKEPLAEEDVKPRLLGHWGTTPGLNFIYVHLNRIIKKYDASTIYICGPGHGGPGLVANAYLDGTYTEVYPEITEDTEGMQKLFKQFSFPGGIPSHVAPETPGSIHEGGELGYALVHAFGAAYDNPDLIVACVVGDGEAETGPLAASWHSNKFLNPINDGAVLPILHLNGYKIANPTLMARMSKKDLTDLFQGYGYEPFYVEGDDPEYMHQRMAEVMEECYARIREIQSEARAEGTVYEMPRWPMIILRSPKGWTGPKFVDNKKVEDFWRSHQVPISEARQNADHRSQLEDWLKSYGPEKLFDENGRLIPELKALAPEGDLRMSANPHTNGGVLRKELKMPDFRELAVDVTQPGAVMTSATKRLGMLLREVMKLNAEERNFRLMGPDETASNRLQDVFEVTDRVWMADILDYDEGVARDGRVMEVLSEHLCQGWLEGYLLTGRHGLFSCYEAFIHIIDSMFNQHAKWLKTTQHMAWRKPISSLNYLLTSHVWRQDHNGFSHQDPGFIDHVVNKKADVVRTYFPPDANTLLVVGDHILRTYNRVNVIVAGKQPQPQWLSIEEAIVHCDTGLGEWKWASNVPEGEEPDVVMAAAGDVPTLEMMAAVDILRQKLPEMKVKVVNVVDLMALQPKEEHPHGIRDVDFDALFTENKPVIFAYHGYPWLIHRLAYRRHNHNNIHVRGYVEEGTTTTPFDMVVQNRLDRYHLAMDAIERAGGFGERGAAALNYLKEMRAKHHDYVREHGQDMPEILDWKWPYPKG
ncbi:phosphoketolase family protein [Martelella lutilitoris]|uniref:Probable phosphoketolase n=1 Tax=Martelella lutilitoris TaxID=2583532 RepID=A0A5C4JN76_9HYPH|nr:phosphoketolase family protein [Martelella lutilitoris]TNB46740.1 phosphoketolase family protein [Martelella lutilitoris]